MATENIAVKAQPRLVIAAERVIQTGSVWPLKPAEQPAPVRQSENSSSMPMATSIGPIASHLLKAEDAPNCVQALELISCAAQTMTSIEHQSKRIQATALALTRHTRSERVEYSQQIASLQDQVASLQKQLDESQKRLEESEARAELAEQQLAQAEERAATAEEWLRRLQEAIIAAFAERRMDNHLDEAANALSGIRG
jgi:valyl-tRNA synthetase